MGYTGRALGDHELLALLEAKAIDGELRNQGKRVRWVSGLDCTT